MPGPGRPAGPRGQEEDGQDDDVVDVRPGEHPDRRPDGRSHSGRTYRPAARRRSSPCCDHRALPRSGAIRKDQVSIFGSTAEFGLTLLTAVAVIVWLWQARANADVIDLPGGWGRPWVIFGWLVPIMNFRVPRAIVGSVWRTSAPDASLRLVNAWWATWVVYLVGTRLARLDLTGTSAHIANQLTLYLPVAADGAAAAVLGALVVRRLTRAQEAQAVRLAEAARRPPVAPGPAVSDPA
ncbi:DUF4328 domain-containing protein [Actinomadura sp. NPDC048394]|uniref:DUF4328 domain-containing protein n=1 Tax=Actinomadura sp. NPDC048394 TaxID=3158223 RepID=UPI0033C193A3